MATLAAALVLAVLAGCGSGDPSAAENGYVGAVQGTDAFVAIVAADTEALVYICNGDEGISEWFEGSIADPKEFGLTNDGGASVQAVFDDETWEGEVTLDDGTTHAFTAVVADDGAGIYQVDDEAAAAEGIRAAWIIDNDGNERGAFLRSGVLVTPTPRSSRTTFSFSGSTFAVRSVTADIIIVEELPMGSSDA